MNRCTSPTARALRQAAPRALLAGLVFMSLGSAAQPVGRAFLPTVLRGILTVTQPPEVLLDGKPDRLSPGARIRDRGNLVVLSGTLVGQSLRVNYVREPNGAIHDVWILTDAEARLPVPR